MSTTMNYGHAGREGCFRNKTSPVVFKIKSSLRLKALKASFISLQFVKWSSGFCPLNEYAVEKQCCHLIHSHYCLGRCARWKTGEKGTRNFTSLLKKLSFLEVGDWMKIKRIIGLLPFPWKEDVWIIMGSNLSQTCYNNKK